MAMVDIALHGMDKPASITDIARRQEIDPGYLEQIFIKLKTAGLVESFRGAHGGYKLSKHANDIKISFIMMAMDEDIKATRCGGDGLSGCMLDKSICLTHHLWKTLETQMIGYLSKISVEDVCLDSVKHKLGQDNGTV
jgi:Rrf2 family protein